jgi:hypothetical protein
MILRTVKNAWERLASLNCYLVISAKYTRYEKAAIAIKKKIMIVIVKGILSVQICLNYFLLTNDL